MPDGTIVAELERRIRAANIARYRALTLTDPWAARAHHAEADRQMAALLRAVQMEGIRA